MKNSLRGSSVAERQASEKLIELLLEYSWQKYLGEEETMMIHHLRVLSIASVAET